MLEASDRAGGRIYTHRFDNGAYGELGAMRVAAAHDYTHYYIRLLGLNTRTSATQRQIQIKTILKNQKLMRLWAKHSPDNFEHKRLLIDAEIARLRGQITSILPLYQAAIASAQAAGYTQNEAIANERCAQFLLETGGRLLAIVYLDNSLASGIFTPTRLRLESKLVWAGAAVSGGEPKLASSCGYDSSASY